MTQKALKVALFFGLPWTVIMTIANSIIKGGFTINILISTAIIGLIVGLVFSFIITLLTNRLYKKTIVEMSEDEKIIKEDGANYFKGKEGVGGKLVLINNRLIFKSHKLNIQNHQDNFELQKIEKVEVTKTLGIFKNGLTIELRNKEMHKFVVDEPDEWINQIENQKKLSK
jgi:GRAM domain